MQQLKSRRCLSDLALVAIATFAMNGALSAYMAIYNNFLVDVLHIGPQTLGFLESMREVPGFLAVAMAAATVQFRESRLAAAALAIMGAGMLLVAGAHSLWFLTIVVVLWSIGFHLFFPLSNGLVLAGAEPSKEGRALGWVGGIGAAGALAGMGMVFVIVAPLGLRVTFVPIGICAVAGALVLLFMRDKQLAPRTRVVFRRRYFTYYALTLLDGSRRQIFSTFAVFLLINVYHLDVRPITALLILNGLVTTVVTPVIGRLIDRYGERRLLVLNYGCLIFLFGGYALVHNLVVLCVLYCIDNAFFAFSLGINSYLGKIAPSADLTPSLVMGTTVNHIAAVGVPIVGGLLWATAGYQITFLAGAFTCVLSVCAALAVHTKLVRAAPLAGVEGAMAVGETMIHD